MSNDDKILENDIQYMLRGCDPHDAEARRHIARCIIAYVREHDGRDAERYRHLRDIAGNDIMRKLMEEVRPSHWDSIVDAAIAAAENGREEPNTRDYIAAWRVAMEAER